MPNTEQLLMGLDVGTTNTKGILYAPERGEIVATVRTPTPSYEPRLGWREYDPTAIWTSVRDCIQALVAQCGDGQGIAAVAAASMGEAGTLYDADGQPLCPIIAWHDPRTLPQRDWWRENYEPYHLYRISGQHLTHIFAVQKMLWIRENWPQAWTKAVRWLCIEDSVIWHLGQVAATDHAIASRTMLLDQQTGDWSDELLEAAQLDREWLPTIHPSGTVVGHVTAAAAQETSLPLGTPIVTAGHDHLCGALACGCTEPGTVLDSTGTTETVIWITDRFRPTQQLFDQGFSHYRHTVADTFVVQGGLDTGGAFLVWTANMLGLTDVGALLDLAAQSTLGANGVAALPFLIGRGTPFRDVRCRATFSGLSQHHTRTDLARAAVEALAYWLQENLQALQGLLRHQPHQIFGTGGANRSPFVRQIKADATGLPFVVPDIAEGAALGAALLAGVGVGMYDDAQAAQKAVRADADRHEPDLALTPRYLENRTTSYQVLCSALAPFHHRHEGS